MIIRSAALNTRVENAALAVTREPDQKTSQLKIRSMIGCSDCSQTTEVAMTLLIMFLGFMAAVTAMTYIEVRRIRKKLNSK